MFTIEQIKAAHSKVKSGADFPNYVKEIKKLGVQGYSTYVSDGHTSYYGADGYNQASPAKYEFKTVADKSNSVSFKQQLKAHQQGRTDYLTFCDECAEFGIEKWVVDMNKMTCTYYDKAGNEMLVEQVPTA
jgi:uncharacterized protein YbcV (DUF1398 family)